MNLGAHRDRMRQREPAPRERTERPGTNVALPRPLASGAPREPRLARPDARERRAAAHRAQWAVPVLGAMGVAALCLITPINDYRLKYTYLYGCHLPVGGIYLFTLLALLYNPVARR